MTTVLDTTLTEQEREDWHSRLLNPDTWASLRDHAEAMREKLECRGAEWSDEREREAAAFERGFNAGLKAEPT